MEVEFSETQRLLRDSARNFLATECPKGKVRELEEDQGKGYSPETWKKLVKLGWLGLIMPEEYGGEGMTFQDLTIVIEEMGRNIFPGPFFCTVITGGIPILEAGTEEQKREYLPKIATGDTIITLALVEGMRPYTPKDIACKATPDGDSFVINGTKLFVEMAHVADYIICTTRTTSDSSEDGTSIIIVNAHSPGIHVEVMPTMGMDKLCEVNFENVAVPKGNLLGERDKGWPIIEKLISKGAIAKCAEVVGGMEASMEMTVSYSKERIQYDRPIGAFQVLQHWMADMYIAMETSRYLCYKAVWLASEGNPCDKDASLAKAYINEAYKSLTQKAVRIHGGMGTTRDHDIGLYFRRAKTMSIAFGDTSYHRNRVSNGIGLRKLPSLD
ncbi:MAG: acyl-CoA/acyl-ACP dehydrogenase [Chloroflexi bacterium]|nr:acyl-CoA/acyl-ACP dehydrogenase [Chloroflexota bacterium]